MFLSHRNDPFTGKEICVLFPVNILNFQRVSKHSAMEQHRPSGFCPWNKCPCYGSSLQYVIPMGDEVSVNVMTFEIFLKKLLSSIEVPKGNCSG